MSGNLVRGEQHLYLQQPAYGTSCLIGKIETDKLAERRRQLDDGFTMKRFTDEFIAAGLVPISLLRWELTGQLPDDVKRMLIRDPCQFRKADHSPGSSSRRLWRTSAAIRPAAVASSLPQPLQTREVA